MWEMRTGIVAGAALTAAVAGLGLSFALSRPQVAADPFAPCREGRVAGGDVGGPFTLVDAGGREVTDAEVFAAPSILYFGYTFCPDICPLDMARNAEAARILEERGIAAAPVFVTIDPARDTPEAVGEFARAFHPRAVGLTGSEDQVAAAALAWRAVYARADEDPTAYLMNHTTFSYLVLPGVGFVDFVTREEPPEAVADRLQCFVEAGAA